jgi:putative peptidoglycan lipid II flippase
MIKNTFVVTFFLVLSSVLGFITQIIYVRSFGAAEDMDLYFKILSFPTIVTGMAPIVFTSVLLPNFAKLKSNKLELVNYIHSIWSYIFLLSIMFSIFGCFIAIYSINLGINDVPDILYNSAIDVVFMIWIGSGLFIASSYLAAILNYDKQFIKVAWTSVLPALLMIVSILLFHKDIGIRSIALGSLLAAILQFIVFFKAVVKHYPINNLIFKKIPNSKLLLNQGLLVILSLLPFTIFVPIGYYWASYLEEGSVAHLGYSQSFAGFLSVATGMGIAIVSFPNLVDEFEKGNGNKALYDFEITLRYVLLISMFCAAAFIALRTPILTLFYMRQSFTEDSVNKLASVIPWYLISAVFIAGLNLLRTLFYSKGEFRYIAILGILMPIVFFTLAGTLKELFSIVGIGVANSVTFALLFFLSIVFIKDKENKFLSRKLLFFIVINSLISIIAAYCAFYCFSWIINFTFPIVAIIICLFNFTAIYFVFAKYIFHVREVIVIEKIIINQIKTKNR